MTADWIRAQHFDNAKDYADAVAVLLGTYGRLKAVWKVDCTITIKCWTKACIAYWKKRKINIGMRSIGLNLQEQTFIEWENAEYLLDGFFPLGTQLSEIVMVHEYAHIITGMMYDYRCNHGPEYQEIYAIMLDDHFDIGAVKRFREKHL